MSSERIRETVVRRARLRENLKPVKAYWCSGPTQPDWLVISLVTGPGGRQSFDLQALKVWSPDSECCSKGVGLIGSMSYETLRIAKAQAHADIGVEYVEWESCTVEMTNEDGSVEWARALPAEQDACT